MWLFVTVRRYILSQEKVKKSEMPTVRGKKSEGQDFGMCNNIY